MIFVNPYIKIVHPLIQELDLDAVYIGGATIPFYVPKLTKSHEYRETLDLDIIVQALSEYWDLPELEKKLGSKGIHPSMDEGDPRCRYVLNHPEIGPIKIDFLSTSSDVHGFPCDYFEDAVKNTVDQIIEPGVTIKIPQVPYIMALKLKAFSDRGVNTFDSKDLQDIVLLLTSEENRKKLREKTPNPLVSTFLWDNFGYLARDSSIVDYIEKDFRKDEAHIAEEIIRFINLPFWG